MVKDFWKDKKVLITGHTGFKGGWLSFLLNKLGAKIIGYSLSVPTNPSFFLVNNLESVVNHNIGDVGNYTQLLDCINYINPDIIFHMAAQPLVRSSYSNPIETYTTNVIGSVNLLEVVRKNKNVKATIIVTSDKCYENNEQIYAYKEQDRLGGVDPYSSSKACAELVVKSYTQSYFINSNIGCVASVRAGNVIGGGDWTKTRLIPDMVLALSQMQSPIIRNPESIRPWQHVLEPLYGYILVAEKIYYIQQRDDMSWNFGPSNSDGVKVKDVANTLCRLWQGNIMPNIIPDTSLHEAKILTLDSSKAQNELKWIPKWNFEETLFKTVEWYKCYYNNGDIKALTNKQIEEYLNIVGDLNILL